MRLPTEILISLLGQRNVHFGSGGVHRLAGRIPLALSATLARFHQNIIGPAVSVEIFDLSIIGVGLIHHIRMYPQEQIMLRITRAGELLLQVQCMITRCAMHTGGKFHIGAQYVRIVEELAASAG